MFTIKHNDDMDDKDDNEDENDADNDTSCLVVKTGRS